MLWCLVMYRGFIKGFARITSLVTKAAYSGSCSVARSLNLGFLSRFFRKIAMNSAYILDNSDNTAQPVVYNHWTGMVEWNGGME